MLFMPNKGSAQSFDLLWKFVYVNFQYLATLSFSLWAIVWGLDIIIQFFSSLKSWEWRR